MRLSNVEILKALEAGSIRIDGFTGKEDPTQPPFDTSAVDLRLAPSLSYPDKNVATIDLRNGKIAPFLAKNSQKFVATAEQPYVLHPHQFILGQTRERIAFPLGKDGECLSGRVEGKSSLARCGVLIHFTAPTIHPNFEGPITLEIINLGPNPVALAPDMYICQLIIERVAGVPLPTMSQFRGQNTPEGTK